MNQDFEWLAPGTRVASTGQQFACGDCNPKGQPRSKYIPDNEPIAIHIQKRYPLCQLHAVTRGVAPYFAEGINKNAPAHNAGAIPTAMRSNAMVTDLEPLTAEVKELVRLFRLFLDAQGVDWKIPEPERPFYEMFPTEEKPTWDAVCALIPVMGDTIKSQLGLAVDDNGKPMYVYCKSVHDVDLAKKHINKEQLSAAILKVYGVDVPLRY